MTSKTYPIIWLIRHSLREDRKTTTAVSETDCSISEEGVKLAEDLATNLKKLLDTKVVDKIYISPYKRTLETSYIIASKFPDVKLEISPLISEVIVNYPLQHMDIRVPQILNKLLHSNNITMPEQKEHVFKRCSAFIDTVNTTCDNSVLVVTHGGIINIILSTLFEWYKFNILERCAPDKYTPKCCDYVAIQYDGNSWQLVTSNWFYEPAS